MLNIIKNNTIKKSLAIMILTAVVFSFLLPFCAMRTQTSAAAANIDLKTFNAEIARLEKKFPANKFWNGGNPDKTTDNPCTCPHNGKCSENPKCMCNKFEGGMQCYGFTMKLSDEIFGSCWNTNKANWTTVSIDNVKPGDTIYAEPHKIFVTAVSGDNITFTDVNKGDKCIIRWGNTTTKSSVKNIVGQKDFCVMRAPNNKINETVVTVPITVTVPADYLETEWSNWKMLSAAADSTGLSITTNTKWSVSTIPSWITLSSNAGTGSAKITITVAANTGAERSSAITITAGKAAKEIKITQPAYVPQPIAFPNISASKYCEFIANYTIPVFRDSACTIRGTSDPVQTTNAAEIWAGDKCQIITLTTNYIEVKYPGTGGAIRTGYIKRGDLIAVTAPIEKITSVQSGRLTTYVNTAGNKIYGYTEYGDTVYSAGTTGSYTAIIHTAKSGSREWIYAFILTSDYNKMKG